MDSSGIICLVIGGLVSAVLIFIGISQIRSKNPVGFYTGEEPPSETVLKDIRVWNIGHGMLWIWYGITMAGCFLLAVLSADSLIKSLLLFCGAIFPLFLMVAGHHLMIRYLYL